MTPIITVLIVAACGAIGRTLLPYLVVLRDNPATKFDRAFLLPPIVSCVISLITLPLALGALPKELIEMDVISAPGLIAVFMAVWGVTDIAREGQKFFGVLLTGRTPG